MSFFAVEGQQLAPYLQSPAGEDAKAAIVAVSGKPTAQFLQAAIPNNPNLGDVWRKISGAGIPQGDWFWNGSYWLSLNTVATSTIFDGAGSKLLPIPTLGTTWNPLWCERVAIRCASSQGHNSTRRLYVKFRAIAAPYYGGYTYEWSIKEFDSQYSGGWESWEMAENLGFTSGFDQLGALRIQVDAYGSLAPYYLSCELVLRRIHQ